MSLSDAFQQGLIILSNDEDYKKGIKTTRDIIVEPKYNEKTILGVFYGKLVKNKNHKKFNEYNFGLTDSKENQLQNSLSTIDNWIGKMNHASPKSEKLNVLIQNGIIWLTKSIKKDEFLYVDYGLDYWVFQITGLDYSEEWPMGLTQNQKTEMENLFLDMHYEVDNYTELLKLNYSLSNDDKASKLKALKTIKNVIKKSQ